MEANIEELFVFDRFDNAQAQPAGAGAGATPLSSLLYIGQFVKTVGQQQPNMAFVSASNSLADAGQISSYYSSKGSLSSYVDKNVDAALNAAATESNPTKRNADFAKALQIGCQTDPVDIFTVNLKDIYGAAKNLTFAPWLDSGLRVDYMSLS